MSRALAILGRSGVLAIGVWCFALMVYFSYLTPLVHKLEQLREFVAQPNLRPSASVLGAAAQSSPLPSEARRVRDLAKLVSAAGKFGVRLTRQNFEEQVNAESGVAEKSGFTRLTGRLTATAQYPALRNWLTDIAATTPFIAIRTLRFERLDDSQAPLLLTLEFEYRSHGKTGPTDQDEKPTLVPESQNGMVHNLFSEALVRGSVPKISPHSPNPIALPFTYSGTYSSAGGHFYLLTLGLETFRVSLGETIGNTAFRLDGADPDKLHFTHLPTLSRLSLPTGQLPP